MEQPFPKLIPVVNLILDTDNPRFAHTLEGEREALTKMVLDQEDDLVRLAEDILKYGLNPNDLFMTTKSQIDPKRFVVHEGNRRLTALKLMSDRQLLNSLPIPPDIIKKFIKLSDSFKGDSIKKVLCVVFKNYEQTRHWIELKHTGKNKGVGVDPWVAFMVNRFKGSLTPGSQAVNLVRDGIKLSPQEKSLLDEPGEYESTLSRVLGSPEARELIGVKMVKKQLEPSADPAIAVENLKKIVLAFANGDKNTNHVYRRPDLINTVEEIVGKKIEKTASPPELIPTPKPSKVNAPNLSRDRRTVAPPKVKLPIDVPRVQDIYKELQTIDVYECPNAAGILIRVFIEQSIDAYARHHGINLKVNAPAGKVHPDKEINLDKKIQLVTSHMKSNGFPASDLKEVETAIHSDNNPLSIHSLHAFVHNPSYSPKSGDLPVIWNNLSNFITALWQPKRK